MRITNRIILDRSIASAGQALSDMARLERQITTGRRHEALSEAVLEGRAILAIDSDLQAAGQYKRNIDAARARLAISDTTLDSVTSILGRAREIGIQQAGTPASADTRAAAREEVEELRDAVIQLANRRLNGAYVFGGVYADLAPLDATGALDPTSPARGAPSFEIGPGVFTAASHDGGEVFIDTDVMGALDALDAALLADDGPAVQLAGDRLRDAISSVQNLVAEVGARQVRLDMAEESHAIVSEGLRARRSQLADTVFEEAVTRLASRSSSYQASLLSTSRLLESSLVNYLR